MRDIIQPRNSIKKQQRLSGKSDDFKTEDSDNEDVFLSDDQTTSSQHSIKHKLEKSKSFPDRSNRVPAVVIERYQHLIAEDSMVRIISKF